MLPYISFTIYLHILLSLSNWFLQCELFKVRFSVLLPSSSFKYTVLQLNEVCGFCFFSYQD